MGKSANRAKKNVEGIRNAFQAGRRLSGADGDAEAGFGSGVGGVAVEGRLVEVGALGGLAVGEGVAP